MKIFVEGEDTEKRWFCKRMFERIPEWLVTSPTNMAPLCWYPCVNYWLKFPNPALGLQFWVYDPISLKWSEVSTVILMVLPGWNSVLPCQPSTRIRDESTLGIGKVTGVACWVGKSGFFHSTDMEDILGCPPFPEIVAHEGLVRDPRAKKRKKILVVSISGKGANPSILSISNYHMVSCRIVVVYDFQQSGEW